MREELQDFLDIQAPLRDGWIRCLIVNHDVHKVTVIDAERANLKRDADFVLAALKRTPNLEADGYREMLAHTIARFVSDDDGNAAQIVAMAAALQSLSALRNAEATRHMLIDVAGGAVEVSSVD